jgi:hypothetical protein
MRWIRSLGRQSPALVISITALVFSLGGGAYAAAQLDAKHIATGTIQRSRLVDRSIGPATAAGLTWHNLPLTNGWVSAPGNFDTGSARYAISGGVVYLKGAIFRVSGTSPTFALLPLNARPAHDLYTVVFTDLNTEGSLYILDNGLMVANGANAPTFCSLATVSYPLSS